MNKQMSTKRGKHAVNGRPYIERWAERYPSSQEAIERDRLAKGKAKHRAHLYPLTAESLKVSA